MAVRWNSLEYSTTPNNKRRDIKQKDSETHEPAPRGVEKASIAIIKISASILAVLYFAEGSGAKGHGISVEWHQFVKQCAIWICVTATVPYFIAKTLSRASHRTKDAGGVKGAFDRVREEHVGQDAEQRMLITPPSRGEVAHRQGQGRMAGSMDDAGREHRRVSPMMTRQHSQRTRTPEQIGRILSDFDEAANAAAQATQSGGEGSMKKMFVSMPQQGFADALQSPGTMLLNTYRPSAVSKGAVSTTVASDGSIVSSLQTERDRVLAELGIDEDILERSIETLREWIACRVLQPLEKAISAAHSNVVNTAASLGFQNVNLTNLNDLGLEPSSKLADDTHTLNQLHHAVADAMASNQMNASNPRYQKCRQAILTYHNLLLLLRGEFLPGSLVSSDPDGYILKRIKELSNGTCMKDFMWNSGGESSNQKAWNSELPTDSALILYLFASFLSAPFWTFADKDQGKVEGPSDILFLGRLPPRVSGKFTAILPTRLPKGSKGTSVQGLQLGGTNPYFSVSVEGTEKLTETGQLGLFRILVIFLFYVNQDNGMLGNSSFEHLHLDTVVEKKKRFHFIDSLRRLHLW